MKFRSFYWALITGTATIFALVVISLGWVTTQSATGLVAGGQNKLPRLSNDRKIADTLYNSNLLN